MYRFKFMGAYIFRYEWLHFRRNRLQVAMLTVLFLFGVYAIYYGNRQIDSQRASLALAQQQVTVDWARYTTALTGDTTTKEARQAYQLAANPAFAWWRHPYLARLDPSALAPLAVGQRDIYPGFYQLTGMSLYYRLFQSELANPQKLLAGNFDLSFVLIYLLPLLVITFSFSVLSGEKESGVLSLLHVQAASVRRVLGYKFLFAFWLVTSLAVLLSILGFVESKVQWSRDVIPIGQWLLTVIGYCTFWFGLLWLIVSFNQPSALNALVAIGFWLLFLLIIPSLLSAYVTVAQPVDSSVLASLSRRESIANEDDKQHIRSIISRYAQLQPGLILAGDSLYEPNREAKGYAAFTQLNDAAHRPMVEFYWRSVAARDALASQFMVINPAVNAQELLSRCAQTDLRTNLAFLESLPAFHQQIARFYLQRLFRNQLIQQAEYAKRPIYQPKSVTVAGCIWVNLIYLFSVAAVLFGLGWVNVGNRL